MHKLFRPNEPEVLAQARERSCADPSFDWECFPSDAKREVKNALLSMQDNRCAYCECTIHEEEGHIEHFLRKGQSFHPELTFAWSNLFYSCQRPGDKKGSLRCGISKDKQYEKDLQEGLLLDPCVDNPEDFLVFQQDGRVSPKTTLGDGDRKRAETTIEVLNLNELNPSNGNSLVSARKNTIRRYAWMKKANMKAKDIDEQLENIRQDGNIPFVSAIFHFYGKRVVPSQ